MNIFALALGFIFLTFSIIVFVFLWAFSHSKKAEKLQENLTHEASFKARPTTSPREVPTTESQIKQQLGAHDELFSLNELKSYARELFIKVQEAIEAKDSQTLRVFEGDELHQAHQSLIATHQKQRVTYVLDTQDIRRVTAHAYWVLNGYEYLTVRLDVSLVEQFKVAGAPTHSNTPRVQHDYDLTFKRKVGVQTSGHPKELARSCPACGAPTTITSSGACDYCQALVSTGDYGWILTGFQQK